MRNKTFFSLLSETFVIIVPFSKASGIIVLFLIGLSARGGVDGLEFDDPRMWGTAPLTNSADILAARLVSFWTQSFGLCEAGIVEDDLQDGRRMEDL